MSKITKQLALRKGSFTKFMRVMRLMIALMVATCLHVAAAGHTQENVTLNLKSVELKKALLTIEKKSEYRFLFNEALLNKKPKIDVQVVNTPVPAVLDQIFQNTGITYKILNNKLVVLKNASDAENLDQITEVRVSGRVTASDGTPLAGVSIVVKGTRTGTTTDANGSFALSVPDNATLVFSSVGYETQEVAVNGRSTINISLVQSTKTIDQIVIVGYGTQRKIDVTGSVGQVKGEEIAKQPDANPLSALQGKVAGVQITNNGAPGAPPSITIRGVGTV